MNWNLIHKYLAGKCTDGEKKTVEQWLQEDSDHKAFLNSMKKIWEVKPKQEGNIDVEAAWKRFRSENMASAKLHPVGMNRIHRDPRAESNRRWYQRMPVYAAAAVLILLAGTLFVMQMHMNKANEVTYQEVMTTKGEKTSLKLSDGTHVMLNAESLIRIPSNYGDENRTLYLEGEAFFEVEHDDSKPFRVYSGDFYTEDLGTKFNIRAFAADSTLEVVVTEGEVEMVETQSKNQDSVHLHENERAFVSKTKRINKQQVKNLSSYIGWAQGKLVFNDTPLRNVTEQLERWYGVECIIQDKELLNRKLTATFENEPLSNVLQLIAKSMNVETNIEKRTVTFNTR